MSASMASNYSEAKFKYDVFISFRGADTRTKFISHLKATLKRKQFKVFIDDESDRGRQILPSIIKAIEESKTSVIIFSENYANSEYCLDELLKILDCMNTRGQIVLPVFYDVDPSDVEDQTGTFGEAFKQLRKKFKKSILDKWILALKEAANLAGFDSRSKEFRNEHELTEKVADFIWEKLSSESTESTNSNGLVGMDSRVKKIQSSFENSTDIFVGAWGMGGIGKTTTVEVLFNRISNQFDGHCFIRNIRELSEKHGLIHLLKEILCEVLQESNLKVQTLDELPTPIVNRLRRKKVLIVLDDVSNVNHLKLAGNREWFCPGSRVILTGRDKLILIQKAKIICQVEGLNEHDAFRLFSLKAFEDGNPPENYMDLSKSMVAYAKGVPLALIILGSLLREKDEEEWSSKLNELEESPDLEIQKVLRISYDELDWREKKIFLDIACFFKGEDRKRVTKILDGCSFHASNKIGRLIDKCLITVVNKKLEMHDLLQDMGRDIVREESFEDLGKRSRLWVPEDITKVLTSNMGINAIEGIFLDMAKIEKIKLNNAVFSTMQNLRLLKFDDNCFLGKNFVSESSLSEDLLSLPNSLRYLHWKGYPWKSFPSNFSLENLVELNVPNSRIEYLWSEENHPQKLRQLDLNGSYRLNRLPNLLSAQNLERIILDRCTSLQEIPPSIKQLHSLIYLSLSGCRCLKSLPSIIELQSLKTLNLSFCSNLEKLPEIPETIEELRLHRSGLKEWSPSTQSLNKVKLLTLDNCKELTSLPSSIHLNSLETLDLSGCLNLEKFPDVMGNIKELVLRRTAIKELPSSIGFLSSLAELNLRECQNLQSLPSSICVLTCLEELKLSGCSRLANLPSLSGLCSLSILDLTDCGVLEIPNDLGDLSSLQKLCLRGNKFESLPAGIKQLAQLKTLDLSYCKNLRCLPELPSGIHKLTTHDCTMLETVSKSSIKALEFSELGDSYIFEFFNCTKLDQNGCNNILADAWSRIPEIARGLEKHSNENGYPENLFRVCLPGCEIPEWFRYQNVGCSITSVLPHDWCNSRFAGLIYCALVEHDYHPSGNGKTVRVGCSSGFENDYGDCEMFNSYLAFHDEPIMLESSHLFLWYDCGYKWIRRKCQSLNKASFEFTALGSRVIRCGVHVLYREDEDPTGTWQPELMQIDNDTELSDEEPQSKIGNDTELSDEEPQSKRLKVSTILMVALFFIAFFLLVFAFFYF